LLSLFKTAVVRGFVTRGVVALLGGAEEWSADSFDAFCRTDVENIASDGGDGPGDVCTDKAAGVELLDAEAATTAVIGRERVTCGGESEMDETVTEFELEVAECEAEVLYDVAGVGDIKTFCGNDFLVKLEEFAYTACDETPDDVLALLGLEEINGVKTF
jgi:hypothetical protein